MAISKQSQIEKTREILKSEFVAIDYVIDHLDDTSKSTSLILYRSF